MKLTEQGSTLFLENKKESQYIVMGTMFFVGVLLFIFLRQEPNLDLFSVGLSLLGIIGVLGIKREYVTVSPSTHLIQTVKKSIISSHQQMVQFSEVQSVLVEEAKGGAKGNKFYYPLLILNFHDGRSISLTKGARSSAFLVDHLFKKEEEIGKRIAEAIGVPFEYKKRTTLSSLAAQFKKIIRDEPTK